MTEPRPLTPELERHIRATYSEWPIPTTVHTLLAEIDQLRAQVRRTEAAIIRIRRLHRETCPLAQRAVGAGFTCTMCDALADTGPRILCAHTRPGHHTTVCDLPVGHGDHDGATGYGERVSWPAATEATGLDCSRTTPNNSAEQPAGPNGLPS